MKISIIAPALLPVVGSEMKYGGIELVISLATEELVRRGHDVYLFASGDSKTNAKLVPIVDSAIGLGVSLEREQEANRTAYKLAVAEKPDVIWDHTMAIHAQTFTGQEKGFVHKVTAVFTPEKMVDTGDIPVVHTLHGPVRDHLPGIVEGLGNMGHYFVTISHDQAKRFLPYIKKQHLDTVYNAVDTNVYKTGKRNGNYYLWVGRFGAEKGAHIALRVAHKLGKPIKMVGKLQEEYEQEYFNSLVKNELSPKDRVYTTISLEEKARLFRNAIATLMTTLWNEPFGLVCIESMASGTPVVAPNRGSLPELIGKAGIVVPVDDLDINEFQKEITKDQEKYIDRVAEYVKNTKEIKPQVPRARVENLFSVKQNTDGYEEAFIKAIYYKKVLG